MGGFLQLDGGTRRAGRFLGLDDNDMTVVEGEVGGAFTELWLGPVVRGQWRALFAELGYGLLGRRTDDARDDLPNTRGGTDGAPLEDELVHGTQDITPFIGLAWRVGAP